MTRYFKFNYESILPAYDGLDTDTAPYAIAKTKAPFVQNFLTDRPGALVMRGPISNSTQFNTPSLSNFVIGSLYVAPRFFMGYTVASPTATRDPWVAPYNPVTSASSLSQASSNISIYNTQTGSVTSASSVGGHATVPRARNVQLGNSSYAIAYGWTNTCTQNGNVYPLCYVVSFDNTSTQNDWPAGPQGAQDVCSHLDRLWVLGGTVPGTTTPINFNTLYWTDPINSNYETYPPTLVWADSVTGLTNQIIVDSDTPNDFGVALARVGQNMAILKRYSLYLMTGYSSTTFKITRFSPTHGCLDARSVVEYESGIYYLSNQGLMWFDGHKLINVSTNLRSSLVAAALRRVGNGAADGGFAYCQALPNNYIMVTIGWQDPTGTFTTPTVDFCGLYSVARNSWSTFSSGIMAGGPAGYGGAPAFLGGTNGIPIAVTRSTSAAGLTTVYRMDSVTCPESAPGQWCGFDNLNQGTQFSRIPSIYKSRLADVGMPVHSEQIHRFWLDYSFRKYGSMDEQQGNGTGWTVQLVGSDGRILSDSSANKVLMACQGDPANGGSSLYPYKRQWTCKTYREGSDAQLQVSWQDDGSGTYPAVSKAEIYDGGFEFVTSTQQDSD